MNGSITNKLRYVTIMLCTASTVIITGCSATQSGHGLGKAVAADVSQTPTSRATTPNNPQPTWCSALRDARMTANTAFAADNTPLGTANAVQGFVNALEPYTSDPGILRITQDARTMYNDYVAHPDLVLNADTKLKTDEIASLKVCP